MLGNCNLLKQIFEITAHESRQNIIKKYTGTFSRAISTPWPKELSRVAKLTDPNDNNKELSRVARAKRTSKPTFVIPSKMYFSKVFY